MRGSLVLRPGANRDKWNTGVDVAHSVFIDTGLNIGAGEYVASANEGKGVVASVQDNAFLGISDHYNDFGVRFQGYANAPQIERNVFQNRGDSRRPVMTIENRTGQEASIAWTVGSGTFRLNDAVFTLTSAGAEEGCTGEGTSTYQCVGDSIGELCNFINGIAAPGEAFRCALRGRADYKVVYSVGTVNETIDASSQRFVLYSQGKSGDMHFGAVEASMQWAALDFDENPLDWMKDEGIATPLLATNNQYGGLRVIQPDTGAEGWVRDLEKLAEHAHPDGSVTVRLIVGQIGDLVGRPLFVDPSEGGGPLVFEPGYGSIPGGADFSLTYTEDYAVTLPEPMRIRDNVFDMFGASADVDKAQGRYAAGHVIRLASSSAETMIDGNRFWAPVQFWGDMPPSGAVNIVNRPDLVLITPAHQLQNSSLINAYTSAADRVDYWWDEDTRPDIEDLHPQPLHFVNNHIGYLPRDEGDLFLDTTSRKHRDGHFSTVVPFTRILSGAKN